MKRICKIAVLANVCVLLACSAFAAEVAVLQNGFSIAHERSQVIGNITRLYFGNGDSGYVDVPTSEIDHFEQDGEAHASSAVTGVANTPKKTQPIPDIVTAVSGMHHLDPDFINSVIHAESAFNPKAVSPKGAQGLMQLMPQTATHLGVTNAFDPGANVEGGTRYLRELLERYNFDMIKALAAYNAGPDRVDKYHGVPPYYETQAYVARIVRDFNRKKLAERKAAAAAKKSPSKPALKQTSASISRVTRDTTTASQ